MQGSGVGERRWYLFLGGDNEGYGNQLVKKNLWLKLTAFTRLYMWGEELVRYDFKLWDYTLADI